MTDILAAVFTSREQNFMEECCSFAAAIAKIEEQPRVVQNKDTPCDTVCLHLVMPIGKLMPWGMDSNAPSGGSLNYNGIILQRMILVTVG